MRSVRERAQWNPKMALLAMFDVLDDRFNHPDFSGCLLVKACMAFPNENAPVHKAASHHYVVTTLEIPELADSLEIGPSRRFAEEWVLLTEGALSHRVVTQGHHAAVLLKRIAEATLEWWVSENQDV